MLDEKTTNALFGVMRADLDEVMKKARAHEEDYLARAVKPEEIGERRGPVHCASLLVWNKVADLALVPRVDAEVVGRVPMATVWRMIDSKMDDEDKALMEKVDAACRVAPFWRTDVCAPFDVKFQLSEDGKLPDGPLEFCPDDRIVELHHGLTEVLVISRPRMTPKRVNGWPVEFRVFIGGHDSEHGAVSWYYPQAGHFEVTPELAAAAESARGYALILHEMRERLGLVPWQVAEGREGPEVGGTVDFMLTEERGLVMIDAGPGWGFNAHPCCFIDRKIEGIRWQLDDGVKIR